MAIYNIKDNAHFDINDVSAAINDVVSMMQRGDSAYLEYNEYGVKNTINICNENYLQYCEINLHGVYTFQGVGPAVTLRANYLKFNLDKITTNQKNDHYKTTPEDTLPSGIEILESNYSVITVDEIEGFEYGLKLCPNITDTGICYTKFTFKYISYCYIPLCFAVDDNAIGWVNENQFYGGRLKGYYGFKAIKGKAQIDECNNNTFYNIAFESIETNGIDLEFCTFNTIISPRFESVMKYTILESENCKSNKYVISVALPLDSIRVKSKYTRIEAPLHTYWEHMISCLKTDGEGNKSYDFFRETTVTIANEVTEIPMNCKNIIVPDEIAEAVIVMDEIAAFENNRINIYIRSECCELTAVDHNDEFVVNKMALIPGKYELFFDEKHWNFSADVLEKSHISLNKAL